MTRNATMRCLGFAIGLAALLAAHAIEVATWSAWFGGLHEPWFLNSGRATAFTLACVFGVSVIGGWLRVPGVMIAAGALAASTLILFFKEGGAGTLFPIVLVAGGLLVAGASLLGAWIGSEIGTRPAA